MASVNFTRKRVLANANLASKYPSRYKPKESPPTLVRTLKKANGLFTCCIVCTCSYSKK